jgi:uridylate kinase
MKKNMVLKVGGSILYDHLLNINFELFEKVKKWYFDVKDSYDRVILVTGGGGLSRSMESKVSEHIKEVNSIHGIAMSITQTNAIILASYIGDKDMFVPRTLGDAYEFLNSGSKGNMVSGGLKVGWSTDMDAAVFADILHTQRVYKVSNVDFLYDKDPKEFFDAQPIRDITWDDYFKMFNIVPEQGHVPNAHIPVSAQCSMFCKKKDISFHITGGKLIHEIEGLEGILREGTFIHS